MTKFGPPVTAERDPTVRRGKDCGRGLALLDLPSRKKQVSNQCEAPDSVQETVLQQLICIWGPINFQTLGLRDSVKNSPGMLSDPARHHPAVYDCGDGLDPADFILRAG